MRLLLHHHCTAAVITATTLHPALHTSSQPAAHLKYAASCQLPSQAANATWTHWSVFTTVPRHMLPPEQVGVLANNGTVCCPEQTCTHSSTSASSSSPEGTRAPGVLSPSLYCQVWQQLDCHPYAFGEPLHDRSMMHVVAHTNSQRGEHCCTLWCLRNTSTHSHQATHLKGPTLLLCSAPFSTARLGGDLNATRTPLENFSTTVPWYMLSPELTSSGWALRYVTVTTSPML